MMQDGRVRESRNQSYVHSKFSDKTLLSWTKGPMVSNFKNCSTPVSHTNTLLSLAD